MVAATATVRCMACPPPLRSIRNVSVRKGVLVGLIVACALIMSITIAQSAGSAPRMSDVVVVNGRVMDPESGLDAVRNVGILGDSIKIITTEKIEGRTSIDATGLVVAPGFIDLHQHDHEPSDYALKVMDGVTSTLELETGTADVNAWYARRTSADQFRRQRRPFTGPRCRDGRPGRRLSVR